MITPIEKALVGISHQAMITLEVESNAICQFEGHTATVRDYKGRKLLEGAICRGRVARKIEKLSEIFDAPSVGIYLQP